MRRELSVPSLVHLQALSNVRELARVALDASGLPQRVADLEAECERLRVNWREESHLWKRQVADLETENEKMDGLIVDLMADVSIPRHQAREMRRQRDEAFAQLESHVNDAETNHMSDAFVRSGLRQSRQFLARLAEERT